jgi:hypothetical protein
MIKVIHEDYQGFVRNSNKRKAQEQDLKRYQQMATNYQKTIESLRSEIDNKNYEKV